MAQDKKFQKRRPDGKFAASRKRNGQFAPTIPAMEGFRPPVAVTMPASAAPRVQPEHQQAAAEKRIYVAPASFEPLTPAEADRFARAMVSAGRTPTSPADRATLAIERRAMEARFGSIEWAA